MRPRQIMSQQELSSLFDKAVSEQALAIVCVRIDDEWHTFKSRFLERDPGCRFIVLDCQETHGTTPPNLLPGQYVGLSFRHKSRKLMFASVIEARGKYVVDQSNSIAAIRYRWPEHVTEMQRRAYYRTEIPPDTCIRVSMWPGCVESRTERHADSADAVNGEAVDLSCGGTLVSLGQRSAPDWREHQTIGLEIKLPDGRPGMLVDAQYRGIRHDDDGNLCVAVQFVGLEVSASGRSMLQRLSRCVQKFHRRQHAGELRGPRN